MKFTRREFITQSTLATVATMSAGGFLLTGTRSVTAQGTPPKSDNPYLYGFLEGDVAQSVAANDATVEINRVPYIAQYYIPHKSEVGKAVTIGYYVTDYDHKEYLRDDDSERFTVEYWVNGRKSTLRDVKAGDNSFVLNALPKGKVLLALQATDAEGRKSHRLFQEFLIVDPQDEAIPADKVLHPDLKQFGIFSDDTHPVETTAGLTKMLQWAHDNGYRKVVLPQGRYRLDENETVQMATNLTLDMNGSTFKLNPNALARAMMMAMVECVDSHVVNGTFEGDLKEHDFKNAPNNSEWVHAVLIGQDSLYCSYENIKVIDVTGYGTCTFMGSAGSKKPKYGYAAHIGGAGPFVAGDIDVEGKPVEATGRLTSAKPVDISKFVETFGFLQLGMYLGYQGNPTGNWVYRANFYDADQKYLESIEGYMYRRMYIPQGAKFARFTLYSNATPERVKGLCTFNFRQPYNCAFRNVHHENVRCVGMAPSGFYNLLVEGCTFENCGMASAKCAFDSEDGWDMMQDLTFRNNVFGKNPHNEFLTADGLNFVIENNVMSTLMWDRTKGSVYRNNRLKSGRFRFGQRHRTSYPRIYNNSFDGGANAETATATPDCAYCVRDSQCNSGISTYRSKGVTVDAAYFYKCRITGSNVGVTAIRCKLKGIKNGGGALCLYDCNITDSNLSISGATQRSFIARSTIENSTLSNSNSAVELRDNTLVNTTLDGGSSWATEMEFVMTGNSITTDKEYLLAMGNSFKRVTMEKNKVASSAPQFTALVLKNPQRKAADMTVAITESTFAGKSGQVVNIVLPPRPESTLSVYMKGNSYTGLKAVNDAAFEMKTVKLLEENPPVGAAGTN